MNEIVKQKSDGELFVFARDPAEMTKAQDAMISWAERKLEAKKVELKDAEENVAIAKKNKWRTANFDTIRRKAEKKVVFYEKVRDALKAGYYIVPDMDVDVFAVRTTAKSPKANFASGHIERWVSPGDQQSNFPPSGEGKFVSPDHGIFETNRTEQEENGKKIITYQRWWEDFAEVDFPFTFAKPEILEATAKALKEKIFDEIGVLPRRRAADPMVVGRVTYKEGYHRKSINFLVAWFMETDDI